MTVLPGPIRDGADDVGSLAKPTGDFQHCRRLHIYDIAAKGLEADAGILAVDKNVPRQYRPQPDGEFVGHPIPKMPHRLFNIAWHAGQILQGLGNSRQREVTGWNAGEDPIAHQPIIVGGSPCDQHH
jgi:hypothetical protein